MEFGLEEPPAKKKKSFSENFKKIRWIKNGIIKEHLNESQFILFKEYSILYIIFFSSYNFGWALLLGAISSVMFPEDIIFYVGDKEKPRTLGVILGIAAFFQFLAGPIIGALSDKTNLLKFGNFEIGKRKPYIYIGMIGYLGSIVLRILFRWNSTVLTFLGYTIFGIIGNIFSTISVTTYTAMFPDLFHSKQYDIVSAVLGFSQLLGGALAVGLFGYLFVHVNYHVLVCSLAFIGLLTTLPICLFGETNAVQNLKIKNMQTKFKNENEKDFDVKIAKPKKTCIQHMKFYANQFINPFRHWNYFWVFFARFIFMFAIASLQSFLLYFLKDCVKTYPFFIWEFIKTEEEAQSVVGVIVFFFGLLSSFLGPLFSFIVHRKYVICLAGIIMIVGSLGFIITQNFTAMCFFAIPFGVGMGSFYAVDMALINEVLPNMAESAKDLAIFAIASSVPFALAAPVMGFLINFGNELYENRVINIENFGYYLLFGFSTFVQILGSIFVTFVKKKTRNEIYQQLLDELEIFDEENIDKILNQKKIAGESELQDFNNEIEFEKQGGIEDPDTDSENEHEIDALLETIH